jgi:hypothetical protein
MKNIFFLFIISCLLFGCARWKIDRPVDEKTEQEHKDHVPPAAVNFF